MDYGRDHESHSNLIIFQACFSQLLKSSTLLRWSFICLKYLFRSTIYELYTVIKYMDIVIFQNVVEKDLLRIHAKPTFASFQKQLTWNPDF